MPRPSASADRQQANRPVGATTSGRARRDGRRQRERTMGVRAGQKLHSAISDVQVVVVKAPSGDVEVGCGGQPMLGDDESAADGAAIDSALAEGPQLGKRYADEEVGIELL